MTNRVTRAMKMTRKPFARLMLIMTALIATSIVSLAISTNRNNPTPLQSNVLTGEFHQNDPEYFYSFVAGAGELTFTLDMQAKNYGGALYVTLYDKFGREMGAID